jgi:hypothetical protein
MILLETDQLKVALAGSSTSDITCYATCRDISATPSYVPTRTMALTNGTLQVLLIDSATTGEQKIVDYISAVNTSTETVVMSFYFITTQTPTYPEETLIYTATIPTGERVEYKAEQGWTIYSTAGVPQTVGETGAAGTDGSDGALTVTEVEIDFGGTPVFEKQITVTDAGVSASSRIIATQSGKAATGKDADENQMDFLLMNCTPASGQFVLNAKAIPGPVSGLYKVNYQFS